MKTPGTRPNDRNPVTTVLSEPDNVGHAKKKKHHHHHHHHHLMPDGTQRIAPVPGQGRLRHQTTHPSHNCTFYPGLDTWICLTCGFYGSDVFKQLAQPCTGAANHAGYVNRGLMPGSSKAAHEFNARRDPT